MKLLLIIGALLAPASTSQAQTARAATAHVVPPAQTTTAVVTQQKPPIESTAPDGQAAKQDVAASVPCPPADTNPQPSPKGAAIDPDSTKTPAALLRTNAAFAMNKHLSNHLKSRPCANPK